MFDKKENIDFAHFSQCICLKREIQPGCDKWSRAGRDWEANRKCDGANFTRFETDPSLPATTGVVVAGLGTRRKGTFFCIKYIFDNNVKRSVMATQQDTHEVISVHFTALGEPVFEWYFLLKIKVYGY